MNSKHGDTLMEEQGLWRWAFGFITTGFFIMFGLVEKRRSKRLDDIEVVQKSMVSADKLSETVNSIRDEIREKSREQNIRLDAISSAVNSTNETLIKNSDNHSQQIQDLYKELIRIGKRH